MSLNFLKVPFKHALDIFEHADFAGEARAKAPFARHGFIVLRNSSRESCLRRHMLPQVQLQQRLFPLRAHHAWWHWGETSEQRADDIFVEMIQKEIKEAIEDKFLRKRPVGRLVPWTRLH